MQDTDVRIDELEQQIQLLQERKVSLIRERIEAIKSGEALELIKKIVWSYEYNGSYLGTTTLFPSNNEVSRQLFNELLDLLNFQGYHYAEAFYDGKAKLFISDNDDGIAFQNQEDLLSFVSEYNLMLDLSSLRKSVERHKSKLKKLEDIFEKFSEYEVDADVS